MLSNQLFKNGLMSNNFDDLLNSNSTLITEEYLHRKLVNRHKLLMVFMIGFHILLLISLFLRHMFKINIQDESNLCKMTFESKNFIYIISNLIFIYLYYNFLKRPNSTLNNIFYYQYKLKFIICLFILPILIISQKLLPQFLCKHSFHNNFNIIFLTVHILIENIFLYYYVNSLIDEFKTFSNFNK